MIQIIDVERLEHDRHEMQMVIDAFEPSPAGYYYENWLMHDGTEYVRDFKDDEYTISCITSINGVKSIYVSTTHPDLETAVCTTFMNASGYKGEYTLDKIANMIAYPEDSG